MLQVKIAVLLDPSNNWIDKYIRQIAMTDVLQERFSFFFSYNPEEVKNFDIVFILGYTKVLKKSFLDSNKLNLVVHESDLPRGRGFSPVQWQILEGKNSIPVSLIEAKEEVDSGDIVEKYILELNGYELLDEIREKQGCTTFQIIKNFLNKYPNNVGVKQAEKAIFYKKRTEKDDELDIDKTIREQFNHFRIANNIKHPLYFIIDGHKFYLKICSDKSLE